MVVDDTGDDSFVEDDVAIPFVVVSIEIPSPTTSSRSSVSSTEGSTDGLKISGDPSTGET